jgi:hypothetical protein
MATVLPSGLKRWLFEGHVPDHAGPAAREHTHEPQPWWKVMCLTGVDYFSTLGYQPGIAALAAGALSPIATLVLVALTLFGALPIYRRVAKESPHGEGSISMLERLLQFWPGKLMVLALLGFLATDFIITITLSAADAAAHLRENPFLHSSLGGAQIPLTLFFVLLLSAVFLKGMKEAVGVAVVLVGIYLALNAVVVARGIVGVFNHPSAIGDWQSLLVRRHGSPFMMLAASLLLFPKLALGLSGFETGVAVMPLVKGGPGDTHENPVGRVANTRKLLMTAAVVMSVFLVTSSFVTTLLIPHAEFEKGGQANGRALAYLAHRFFGDGFGTVYDVSTVLILWFAGASAMAGLLNIVPRYLPRYGMAPDWTRAQRPLILVYSVIAIAVTLLFRADVDAQGGAYATGVLVLMTSAAVAATISARQNGEAKMKFFAAISLVFVYTTIVNVIERPEGLKIAAFFVLAIVVLSMLSRSTRSLELRASRVVFDDVAQGFIDEALAYDGRLRLVPNHPETRDFVEYERQAQEVREDHHLGPDEPILFLEVYIDDPSEFHDEIEVCGTEVGGYRILRAQGAAIPNTIAAIMLHLRDVSGRRPHAYFNWTEGNPFTWMLRFLISGTGEIAPVTREILRKAERDPNKRPSVHAAM